MSLSSYFLRTSFDWEQYVNARIYEKSTTHHNHGILLSWNTIIK